MQLTSLSVAKQPHLHFGLQVPKELKNIGAALALATSLLIADGIAVDIKNKLSPEKDHFISLPGPGRTWIPIPIETTLIRILVLGMVVQKFFFPEEPTKPKK